MKLIDVDALIERLKPYAHRYDDDDEVPYSFIYDGFIYEIEQEPTIDAEPVIRCKDCKWYEFDEKLHCGLPHGIRMKDDYCSDAERKE